MKRPEGIPEGATYNPEEQRWESGPVRSGARHGAFLFWRDDGTKLAEVRYKEGERHGPFRRFHPSGEVAREGSYRAGEVHGTATWRREEGSPEAMFDGAGEAVARTDVDYDMGRVLAVRHFDAEGKRILADGTALPEQPKGVPSLAEYDVKTHRWFHGPKTDDGQRTGLWMWWTTDGTVVEESEFRDGHRQGVTRRYDDVGTLIEEGSYAEGKKTGTWSSYSEKDGAIVRKVDYDDDQLHGSYIEYGPDGRSRVRIEYEGGRRSGQFLARIGKDKYQGGKIRVEKGHFKDGHPVGRWKLLDKNLKPIFTVDFGQPRTSEEAVVEADIFLDETRAPGFWQQLAESYFEERIISEGLVAMARAAAASGDGGLLANALDERTAPLSESAAEELADEVLAEADDQLHPLVGALVQGADPPRLLQALAITLDRRGRPTAARDFIDAALLVAPAQRSLHYTRALVSISLGEADDALADAAALEHDEPENASFLRAYVRALFPRYAFWPADAEIESGTTGAGLARDLEAVGDALQRYATRFEAVRRQLLLRSPGVMEWAPPDPAPLLPDGPAQLRRDDEVNELLDVNGLDLPRLLTLARANWAALTWLCWAVGQKRAALPRSLSPRPQLPLAAGMARERHRWAKQRVSLGDDPEGSFRWEDVELVSMPAPLAEVCLAEQEAIDRALRWLTDEGVRSPFAIEIEEP